MRPGGFHGTTYGGQPPQQHPGPTPTLNQLLQSSGSGTSTMGNGQLGGPTNSGSGGANGGGTGHPKYAPSSGYDHTNSYPVPQPPPPHSIKTDTQQYPPPPPPSGWPPSQQGDRPPPPHVNNYHPAPHHMVDQQMYRQGAPPHRVAQGQPPPGGHQPYYNPPPMHHGSGQYPPQSHYPPPGPPGQQPRYPPPGRPDQSVQPQQPPPTHYPGQPQSPHYPPPPSQSPHYPQGQPGPPHPSSVRYAHPGPGMRPGENAPYPQGPQQSHYPPPPHRYPAPGMRPGENPPSHYHPVPSPGMTDNSGHVPPGRPPSAGGNSLEPHPASGPRSTPPPPQSPSLPQHPPPSSHPNHHPPSPSQSPRSTPQLPPPGGPPSQSPSHRPTNNYPPPDVGDMTGCNSNDSASGPIGAGIRPSPSPTGSASSRSMSPAVGNPNIPMTPRPWSGQTDGGSPRIPSDHYRSKIKKADSLNKLYEMDENPDRRMFLDKLLHFMEDSSTPITACPQISKNSLDLYKLYILVKERGGFLEVTRNKTWKDIAGSLGIGASSSAAYTLRKHYTKHILPFECKYDRGGIDPQPLINQVEQQTKKKGSKAAPVPSPGSSNSQDSFPGPNSSNNTGSMDSFPGYPSPYGQQPDYNTSTPPGAPPPQQQRPPPPQGPAQAPPGGQPLSNQPPHPGEDNSVSVSNPFDDIPSQSQSGQQLPPQPTYSFQPALGGPGYQTVPGNYPPYPPPPGSEHYGRVPPPPGHEQYQQYPGYPPPPGRQMYPGYPPPGQPDQSLPNSQAPPPAGPPGQDDPHQRYSMGPPPPTSGPQSGGYPPRTPNYAPNPVPPPMNGYSEYYQHPNDQGYPPLAGSPPQGAPSPSSGKHMPPPHPSHPRGMNYPPPQPGNQKDGPPHPPVQGQQPYPNSYPPQGPPQQQHQPRIPPQYDQSQGQRHGNYMYPPPGVPGREPQPNRSSPSPSTSTVPPQSPLSQTAKQWIPPEGQGWPPNPSNQYPPRPYLPPGGSVPHPQQPHAHPSTATTPIPPSQSPVAQGGPPPTQSPSPQPWQPNTAQPAGPVQPPPRGPNPGLMGTPPAVPWGSHSGGTVMSPQPPTAAPPTGSQPWPQQQRHPTPRTPYPPSAGKGPEMYKGSGYPQMPPGAMMQTAGPTPPQSPVPKASQMTPINQLSSMSPMQPSSLPPSPVVYSGQQPAPFGQLPMAPPAAIKKEIVFPSDVIESIQPVVSRRRKLQRGDVAPVEAWRIMMSLKSGLLAETTWALDVLNVLLYDDLSITYFSLNYLPGLLDVVLEHLRRSLVLIFGQSVGIDLPEVKPEDSEDSEKMQKKWYELSTKKAENSVDLGLPLEKPTSPKHSRLVVLSGTNYTLKSRNSRPMKVLPRDDDLFVYPGPREWDLDEKARLSGDVETSSSVLMDVTKHLVTSFTADLNIVPVIRVIRDPKRKSITIKDELFIKAEVKVEPVDCDYLNGVHNSTEAKVESVTKSSPRVLPKKGHNHLPPPIVANGTEDSSSNSSATFVKAKKDKNRILVTPVEMMEVEENTLIEAPLSSRTRSSSEFLSDNAVMMNGLETNESSNQSLTSATENSSSDFCDSNTTNSKLYMPLQPETVPNSEPAALQLDAAVNVILRDGIGGKRKRIDDFEDECFTRDEASLGVVTETQDGLARRCLSILNILRSLTFVPGNDIELGKSQTFLSLLGKLILLHHDHPLKTNSKPSSSSRRKSKEDEDTCAPVEDDGLLMTVGDELEPSAETEDETDENIMAIATAAAAAAATIDSESCTSLNVETHWWWDYLHHVREHVLVMLANISGQLDLSQYSEEISRPILDGLLHWAVCPAAYGQDPFPTIGHTASSSLSPRRLAVEALCKLSVTQSNVDLLLATPPFSRIERLCHLLTRGLCRSEDQVVREFSINLLSYLSAADAGVSRTIALQNPCISLLIAFIEQAESNARNIVENHGFSVLRENPESMGTSLDMLRRAATTLHNLAKHPENHALFVQHEPRLLQLVMSQILEQKVAAIVAQVLFTFSMAEGGSHWKTTSVDPSEMFYTPSLSRSRVPIQPPVPYHQPHPQVPPVHQHHMVLAPPQVPPSYAPY